MLLGAPGPFGVSFFLQLHRRLVEGDGIKLLLAPAEVRRERWLRAFSLGFLLSGPFRVLYR